MDKKLLYSHELEDFTQKEKLLISLPFGKEITKQDIDILTNNLNVYKENQSYILLLSYLGFRYNWKFFPEEIISKIKETNNIYKLRSILNMSWFIEKIRALNHANIPVMLLKGLALKYHYAVGYTRMMFDFDIAVPESKYKEAINLLKDKNSVYNGEVTYYHGEIKCGIKRLDVHWWLFKNNGEKGTDIWEKAKQIDFFGTKVYVMCPQDMFIHQLDTRSRDVFSGEHVDRRLNWVFDCRCILDFMENFSMKEIYSRAGEFSATYSVRYLLPLFSKCFPNLMDKKEIEHLFPYPKKYKLWLKINKKYNKLIVDYNNEYQDDLAGSLTPVRFFKGIRVYIISYRLWCLEKNLSIFSFPKYCKEILRVNSIADLWKKYIVRIRFVEW